jgi:MFS family permease
VILSWYLTALVAHLFPNWRDMLLVCTIPAIASAFLCYLIPESPKWLLVNGKLKKAEKLVRKIRKVS